MTLLERVQNLFRRRRGRGRCVVMGCANAPNGRGATLCVEHELELAAKIRAAVDRVRVAR